MSQSLRVCASGVLARRTGCLAVGGHFLQQVIFCFVLCVAHARLALDSIYDRRDRKGDARPGKRPICLLLRPIGRVSHAGKGGKDTTLTDLGIERDHGDEFFEVEDLPDLG